MCHTRQRTDVIRIGAREHSADRRSENEAKAKRRAEQAERFGARGVGGDVGGVGVRGRDVARSKACNNARNAKKHTAVCVRQH